MDSRTVIRSQYLAALAMLEQAIVDCPEPLWYDTSYKNRFWHIAYHALFYTHLYLQETLEDFVPWEKHSDTHSSLRQPDASEGQVADEHTPYSQDAILEYLAMCQTIVEEKTAGLDLDAQSGFHWLPFGKLELQFYNIRHLQHHTGELCERLGTKGSVDVGWVAMAHDG
jgi:hypothetical protein